MTRNIAWLLLTAFSVALVLACDPVDERPPPRSEVTEDDLEVDQPPRPAPSSKSKREMEAKRRRAEQERRQPRGAGQKLPAPDDVAAPPSDAEKTKSGLASRVLTKGEGTEHPGATDIVTVHYTGWTTDGNMFDSSVVRGETTSFPLNKVIKGTETQVFYLKPFDVVNVPSKVLNW